MTPITLSLDDFDVLRRLIQGASGIWLGDSKTVFLQIRLAQRMQAVNIQTAREYYHFLKYDPSGTQELQKLIDLVTINETWFFREIEPLKAWRDGVLPGLMKTQERVRIWSAGCSTGEEAYTVAMLLANNFPTSAATRFEIVGTDISQTAVDASQAALYDPHSLRHVEPGLVQPYLEPVDSNGNRAVARWRVTDRLRRFVRFQQANLLDAPVFTAVGSTDLVVCRNVMIYFNDTARQKLLNNFFDSLRHGGCLILGHSESLAHVASPFELVHVNGVILYRKP